MTTSTSEIAQILLNCEENGSAPAYIYVDNPTGPEDLDDSPGAIVPLDSEGREIFVVSDLHLAAGVGGDGRYDGCENFFYDDSFHRFLRQTHQNLKSSGAILIINGDFIDFLRVTYVPGREKGLSNWQKILKNVGLRRRSKRIESFTPEKRREFMGGFIEWQQILERIGIHRSAEDLAHSVSDKEEIYGLKTHDYKSVLRLHVVMRGHAEFFDALAEWLGFGHKLIVVKGNHDLEWYWRAVRNYMRLELAERLAGQQQRGVKEALTDTVLPNLLFIDHAMIIDGDFYVEHGHPYDPLTRVIGSATLDGGEELNIPFGSFFNRYLLNFIEMDNSYLDNIRPTKNILPLMLRHKFFTGLKLLYQHLAVIIRTVPKQYIRYIFGQHIIGRVLLILLIIAVPPVFLIRHQVTNPQSAVITILEWVAWVAAVYVLIQAVAQFQLKEPDSLAKFARHQFAKNGSYRLITFGHTHNPDQFEDRGRWFYNTGTWIPVVETTTASLRTDRTFTYVHLRQDSSGQLQPSVLKRWDDEATRTEPMVLIRGAGA